MNESRIIRPYPGFIIPTRRFVDVGMPSAKVGASGRYKLFKVRNGERTGEETPWFDNIILDSGLNQWGTGTIILGAAIGTGTSTPAATDTGLQTQTHYTTTSGTGAGISAGVASNYNNTRTFSYRTTLGALNGNYSEVGVGWASGSMFSRALILDGGGSPTTITVTSAEQLDIVYQLSVYPPLVDTGPTTFTISGIDYDVTGRAANVTAISGNINWSVSASTITGSTTVAARNLYTGTLGAITTLPSGTPSDSGTWVMSSYANNSYTREGYVQYTITQGNISGGAKSSVATWTIGAFQYEFDPVIPKDGTKTLALNYSVTWARR